MLKNHHWLKGYGSVVDWGYLPTLTNSDPLKTDKSEASHPLLKAEDPPSELTVKTYFTQTSNTYTTVIISINGIHMQPLSFNTVHLIGLNKIMSAGLCFASMNHHSFRIKNRAQFVASQGFLIPNVSNTSAWSVALHFEVWHCRSGI